MVEFGRRLRWRCVEKGMTQEAVAQEVQVHRTTYVKYETGVASPPLETLCCLADLLECTTDWLLGRA